MHVVNRLGHVVGGTLLVSATAIGIGMLAMPVTTGPGGFIPATAMYLIIWLFMLCTGLLVLEVCTWMPKDANFITMAHRLLGPIGKGVCWVFYLFLFFMVMISHITGGGATLSELLNGSVSKCAGMTLYTLLFSPFIYFSTKSANRLNILMMLGMLITFSLFIFYASEHVSTDLLKHSNWAYSWIALPVLFTAFTYQLIIPTLMTYMDRNVKKVRLAIILGSTIPLIVYLIWEILILGVVPPEKLMAAHGKGDHAVMALKNVLSNPAIYKIGSWFSFFVLTASYVPFSLAFLDFIADGLKIKKVGVSKVALALGIFLPPLVVSLIYPDIFLKALGYAGGISCAILFGLMPPLMVWAGRYVKKYEIGQRILPGGKFVLVALILLVAVELALEILEQVS